MIAALSLQCINKVHHKPRAIAKYGAPASAQRRGYCHNKNQAFVQKCLNFQVRSFKWLELGIKTPEGGPGGA